MQVHLSHAFISCQKRYEIQLRTSTRHRCAEAIGSTFEVMPASYYRKGDDFQTANPLHKQRNLPIDQRSAPALIDGHVDHCPDLWARIVYPAWRGDIGNTAKLGDPKPRLGDFKPKLSVPIARLGNPKPRLEVPEPSAFKVAREDLCHILR